MKHNYKLQGFNNLTKTLNINFYKLYYVREEDERIFKNFVYKHYGADKLTYILEMLTQKINANILNISKQNYQPQGSSVNIMISEELSLDMKIDDSCNGGNIGCVQYALGHLDKSHITAHTYPEIVPLKNICIVRTDIEVSTCGDIPSITTLNYLIDKFKADIISADYKVRGFTRDIDGKKCYADHKIKSIQDFISKDHKKCYTMEDLNLPNKNIFYTKMMLKHYNIDAFLFKKEIPLTEKEQELLITDMEMEIKEIIENV
ncbi:adenosylmethionine decarboxylase [Clostridiaceae bacterium M8S5]|nr:adenosylmethionine decarboxylase [Clostridiaceae bacterium M8S5]